jgi:hypothetical protein
MDAYISGFIDSVNTNIDTALEKAIADGAEDDLNKSALDDADVKLSFYRSFRSLYDKWISKSENGQTSGYFFNNYGSKEDVKDERMLYDHFSFITRGGTDIGGVAVIDVAYLSNLSNKDTGQGSTQSLYNSLTELLGKNNFDFFALPSLINYSSKDETALKDIFTAFDGPITIEPAKPGFICLFVGGSSRTLDIPQSYCNKNGIAFEYVNDSFDINEPETYPEDIKNNGGITAFLIKYGQQSQNHFSSIQLDQAEFKETQESLMVIDALVNPKTGSQPSQAGKGNNIYDTYLTRSYSCTVEMLGDMMIQPLMYFKLENVPMFRGTYIIKNVSHEIKPHNVKTTFVGVRQPVVTVPIVTDAISLLDLSLIDANETAGTGGGSNVTNNSNTISNYSDGDISTFNNTNTNAKGCEIIQRLKNDLSLSDVQAAGIVGNLVKESGLISDRIQEGYGPKTGLLAQAKSGGYGLAQWTSQNRKDGLKTYASSKGLNLDTSPLTDEIAYGYLVKEIQDSYSGFLKDLKTKTTLLDSAKVTCIKYEAPAAKDDPNEWQQRATFGQNILDSCNNTSTYGGGSGIPPACTNCSSTVKFGIDGSGNLSKAKNAIVGSSSVGTLNGMSKSSTYGNLSSNNISVYYNCGGKTLSWLKQQIGGDGNTYPTVGSFFQVGIGTNDGYPVKDSTKKDIKAYTELIKKKFPSATLYVLPGTRGWGSVSNTTLSEMKSYYKQYTDLGWTLLWPKNDSNVEIDPFFNTQTKAHDSSSEWFKKQMKRIKENKS